MKNDAIKIINEALKAADPYGNVFDAMKNRKYPDDVTVIAVGKAACVMAKAAYDALCGKMKKGYVLTKYFHSIPLPDVFTVNEAGHPVPDENSVKYTAEIIDLAKTLTENDKLIMLISGGASAIFECPLIPLKELEDITGQLLRCSAEITEINAVRKRLSAVKGGKFAKICNCSIDCYVLSDVLGDRLDVIASGPCAEDKTTDEDIKNILGKYTLDISDDAKKLLAAPSVTNIDNVESFIAGNIEMLCKGAEKAAGKLGYDCIIKTLSLTGEAKDIGTKIASDALEFSKTDHKPTFFIYGGETTVTVKGTGKGGRNQELALAGASVLKGTEGIILFSVGSDGTDGPTDAAGGMVDGVTYDNMVNAGIDPLSYLANNDAYNALKAADSLIITGPTGTNVNDITGVLVK